jgi:hypothetical protein
MANWALAEVRAPITIQAPRLHPFPLDRLEPPHQNTTTLIMAATTSILPLIEAIIILLLMLMLPIHHQSFILPHPNLQTLLDRPAISSLSLISGARSNQAIRNPMKITLLQHQYQRVL